LPCRDESGEAINASIFGRLVAFAFGFGRAGFFLALSLKKESKKEAGVILKYNKLMILDQPKERIQNGRPENQKYPSTFFTASGERRIDSSRSRFRFQQDA
jgi:hypothetical protein